MKKSIPFSIQAVINSYAILFFSQNKILGLLLLAVSFFNPTAGIAGLLSVIFTIGFVSLMGYCRESTRIGLFSFNSLLLGIGFGTFYQFNISFFCWLLIGCLITAILSVTLATLLGKYGYPLLSVPFVITFWIVLATVNSIYHMGLEQKNSAILNELSTTSKNNAFQLTGVFDFSHIPYLPGLFFRALSAVLFQNNILTGIIISIGLLIHSRINFSLLFIAFTVACLFNKLTGTYPEGFSYYHLGSNVMMASAAIGSFFLIPSARSYLWALITVPITMLFINGFTKILGIYDLPVLSLPFCLSTFLLLVFFRLRISPGKLQLTILQHYSPERNLYQYLNAKERLDELKYFKFNLPFMGRWTISQGYDGTITHKEAWGKALDFVIKDEDGNTYKYPGIQAEQYYCYNKPVLACGDGIVEEVVTHIDDNEIGQVNTIENWGNTIVIKHLTGLYSKVSHLKKNSIKVKTGDFVKQGDLIALCGNSGRSPEPHLHFQVQTTPYIGSQTLAYPFSYFIDEKDNSLCSFKIPSEGEEISPLGTTHSIKQAFKLQPGYLATVSAADFETEHLEVFTDAYNQSYIQSKTTGAVAYFINNGSSFYFTSFYGDQKSLLFYFYLAAYKVMFVGDEKVKVTDAYPVQLFANKPILWLHDVLAPFKQFIKLSYNNACITKGAETAFCAEQHSTIWGSRKKTMEATVLLNGNSIQAFTVSLNGKKVEAKWIVENIY
ncbi:urea transporter [Mucilaginibacter sp.]|uniref:urea transporter n=1 Tax=Mucilaginibacter sp. TaxID=1882438 RepID=UPI003D140110